LDELLPTAESRAVYDDASASLEAGRLVRDFRKRAGLTQSQLARKLDVSQARVCAIETGEGRDGPSYGLLKRIATACNAPWPGTPSMRPKSRGSYQHLTKAKIVDENGYIIGKLVELKVASGTGKTKKLAASRSKFDPSHGVIIVSKPGSKTASIATRSQTGVKAPIYRHAAKIEKS